MLLVHGSLGHQSDGDHLRHTGTVARAGNQFAGDYAQPWARSAAGACSTAVSNRITVTTTPSKKSRPGSTGSRKRARPAITLAGHDRGASQAAAYAGQPKADRAVTQTRSSFAPLLQTFDDIDREYFLRYKKVLRDELSRAEQMIVARRSVIADGRRRLSRMSQRQGYGGSVSPTTTPTIRNSSRPACCRRSEFRRLSSGARPIRRSRELSTAMRDLGGQKNIVFEEVQSADHFFRDAAADELADQIKDFLGRKVESAAVAPPPPVPQPQAVKMKTRK